MDKRGGDLEHEKAKIDFGLEYYNIKETSSASSLALKLTTAPP